MPEAQAGRGPLMHRWGWAIGAGAVLCLILFALAIAPGSLALYETYWGKESIRGLFYEQLGFSSSWSSFIAIIASFFYGLAWVPLTAWTARVVFWRFTMRRLATAFACWVFIYGHVPLLEALLGSDTCFNQRTGVALKWYVEDSNGQITLFDSPGFDPISRVQKQPVTPSVCRAFSEQKNKQQPRRIRANLTDIEFFDPNTGHAKVWYSKRSNGTYLLYDRSGFDPVTSDRLKPVTKDIVAALMVAYLSRQKAAKAAAQKKAEAVAAEEARRQAAAEAEQRAVQARQRAAEAQRRAAEARREAAAAEAQRAAAASQKAHLVETERKRAASPFARPLSLRRPATDIRAKFGAGSIKAVGKDLFIGGCWYCGSATLLIRNLSGVGFDAAIKSGSTAISGCQPLEGASSGLALTNGKGQRSEYGELTNGLTYVPAGAQVLVTVKLSACNGSAFKTARSADVGITLVIRYADTTFDLPVNASNVPVRLGGFL